MTAGRLASFLLLLTIVGLLTVPRAVRAIVRSERNEMTVVGTVGIAFGFAWLAAAFGYSVALGAFIAGSLVSDSGVARTIEHLVAPVKDVFAAIFFVSVGMLIDPAQIAQHWPAVLIFFVTVVVGQVSAVTISAFLTGQSVQTSVQAGMSMAQIGEFSFIIAGIGVAHHVTDDIPLYTIAVSVSAMTTLLTPWLIRAAKPTAALVDHKLPRALQTFVALYGSWIERLRSDGRGAPTSRVRHLARWLSVDAALFTAVVIGASLQIGPLSEMLEGEFGFSPRQSMLAVFAAAAVLSAPFCLGMLRMARALGFELAARAFPRAAQGKADMSEAARRLLIVTLQMAIVVLVGGPVVAITQPFLPPLQGAAVLLLLLGVLAVPFWRGAKNFQGHARAAAQVIAEVLAQETETAQEAAATHNNEDVERVLAGLGSPVPVRLAASSPAVGRTLADIDLRGVTGATVLAIQRGENVVPVPSGHERLAVGDVLAVAGREAAINAAKELLEGAA